MARDAEWEKAYRAIQKLCPAGERSDALRPGVWLQVMDTFLEPQQMYITRKGKTRDVFVDYQRNRPPVDKVKLAQSIKRVWNRAKAAFLANKQAASKKTGEGTMTAEQESEILANNSEDYHLMLSILYQQAAKEKAMAGDTVAKEHRQDGMRVRDKAAGVEDLVASEAEVPPAVPPTVSEVSAGAGGRGRDSTSGTRGGASGGNGRGRASTGGGLPGSSAGSGRGNGSAGRRRTSRAFGLVELPGRSVMNREQEKDYFAPRRGSLEMGGEQHSRDEGQPDGEDDADGEDNDDDLSWAGSLGQGDDGNYGPGSVDLEDDDATDISAGRAGRQQRSAKGGGGMRKQTYRNRPGDSDDLKSILKKAVNHVINKPSHPPQQASAAVDPALAVRVGHNTQLAQRSHEVAQQSLQKTEQSNAMLQMLLGQFHLHPSGGVRPQPQHLLRHHLLRQLLLQDQLRRRFHPRWE
ncbi:unnamed protein product [Ectocarpus sp. CCAP 1310/34]|nr:unnamed protein product [Ectocarpus sp. CCAP 1310/34]